MEKQKGRIQPTTIGLSVAVVALAITAGLLGYSYTSAEGQLSSLKDSGQAYCTVVHSAISSVIDTFSNVTQTLQAQIQADNSMIASLNASRPSGYEGLLTTLNAQISQDSGIIAQINSYTSLNPPAAESSFCLSVAGP